MKIKPGSPSHLILLALRAGSMEPCELEERFPSLGSMRNLVESGFVTQAGNGLTYSITQSGRDACPQRRSIKPEINENSYYFENKPTAQPSGVRLPRHVVAETKEETVNQMADKAIKKVEKSMETQTHSRQKVTLKHVLDLVILRPGIKRAEVLQCLVYGDGSNKKQVQKIIVNATAHGRVTVDDEDRLHPGTTINSSLLRGAFKEAKKPKEKAPVGKVVPYHETGEKIPNFGSEDEPSTQNDGGTQKLEHANLQSKNANLQSKNANLQTEVANSSELPSNVMEFKKPASDTGLSVSEQHSVERQYSAHDVYIDATGQLIIQQPGLVRMIFPPEDTRRIQKLLLAIDLESLCA